MHRLLSSASPGCTTAPSRSVASRLLIASRRAPLYAPHFRHQSINQSSWRCKSLTDECYYWQSQGDSLSSSSSSSGSVKPAATEATAAPGMMMLMVLVAQRSSLTLRTTSLPLVYVDTLHARPAENVSSPRTAKSRRAKARSRGQQVTGIPKLLHSARTRALAQSAFVSQVESPPAPSRSSTPSNVKKWLAWFGRNQLMASKDEIAALQQAFGVAGNVLLALTKEDCKDLSPRWGIMIYNALRSSPTTPTGTMPRVLPLSISSPSQLCSSIRQTEFFALARRAVSAPLRPDRRSNTLVLGVGAH